VPVCSFAALDCGKSRQRSRYNEILVTDLKYKSTILIFSICNYVGKIALFLHASRIELPIRYLLLIIGKLS
jgi:hypothetical protein